jgi:hypothetical protein
MDESRHASLAEVTRRRVTARRFAVLGAALLTTIAAVMVLTSVAERDLTVQMLISVPLLASLYALSGDLRLLVLLGGSILALTLLAMLFTHRGDTWLLIADIALRAALIAIVIAVVAGEVMSEVRISLDTILGGICIYLLLGFFYAHAYVMLALADAGALLANGKPFAAISGSHPLQAVPAIVYYSYATLTTVAYGDITPATPLARFVAITEAMFGQLFPAIFIARLVSLNAAQTLARGK